MLPSSLLISSVPWPYTHIFIPFTLSYHIISQVPTILSVTLHKPRKPSVTLNLRHDRERSLSNYPLPYPHHIVPYLVYTADTVCTYTECRTGYVVRCTTYSTVYDVYYMSYSLPRTSRMKSFRAQVLLFPTLQSRRNTVTSVSDYDLESFSTIIMMSHTILDESLPCHNINPVVILSSVNHRHAIT